MVGSIHKHYGVRLKAGGETPARPQACRMAGGEAELRRQQGRAPRTWPDVDGCKVDIGVGVVGDKILWDAGHQSLLISRC